MSYESLATVVDEPLNIDAAVLRGLSAFHQEPKFVRHPGEAAVARDYNPPSKDEECRIGSFGQIVYERAIDYTDCPEGVWKFYFIGNILMLPQEY